MLQSWGGFEAATLTLLYCSHNVGIFSLIPIFTHRYAQPSQTLPKIKPEVGWENRH